MMLGRLVARVMFLYHVIGLKLRPEAYEVYAARQRVGTTTAQCKRCWRKRGHSFWCKRNPHWKESITRW